MNIFNEKYEKLYWKLVEDLGLSITCKEKS